MDQEAGRNEVADTEQEAQRRRSTRRVQFGLVAVGVFAVGGLAACSSASIPNGAAKGPVVSAGQTAAFGTVLMSGGKALYTLAASSTPCDSACTKIWPEFTVQGGAATAQAGSGVDAASLGTVDRGGGVRQVTYGGKALYFFSEDAAGQITGNITDVWGKWTVASTPSPAANGGAAPTTSPPTTAAPAPKATVATTAPPPATTKPPAPTTTSPPPPTTTTSQPPGGGGGGF